MEKICPVCKKTFFAKRINQIYCNTNNFYCRNFSNNEKARIFKEAQGDAPKIINANWKILNSLLKDNKEAVFSSEFLKGKGLNLAYFTQFKRNGDKNIYCINNIKIELTDNQNFKIYK